MKPRKETIGRITQKDYIKAQRRASREEEIFLHGKPVSAVRMLHRSRKAYDRRQGKAVPEADTE